MFESLQAKRKHPKANFHSINYFITHEADTFPQYDANQLEIIT